MKSQRVPEQVSEWASRNGRKGGSVVTEAKSRASSENLARARELRWLSPAQKRQALKRLGKAARKLLKPRKPKSA